MTGRRSPRISTRAFVYLVVLTVLGAALWFGRSRAAPNLTTPIGEIFPTAVTFVADGGIFRVYDQVGTQLGWAAAGSAIGYGGPLLLVTGVDTLGRIAGARIVEQRETPVFWRMARAGDLVESFTGSRFSDADFDDAGVDWDTGATISTDAIIASLRMSVAEIAGEAFDVRIPLPNRPFEFGFFEITILALFAVGITARMSGSNRQRQLRWASQISALIVIGFWKHSPISLAKIASLMAGYFPDPRSSMALYLLVAGFLLTSIMFGRNIYCTHICPFNAAQRLVGLIGGARVKLPTWLVKTAEQVRNVIVFSALFLALLTLKPALAGYEPFAALFSLTGTTLQWLLLFVVLTMSLFINTPWCNLLCPVRTVEKTIHDIRGMLKGAAWRVDG